MPSISRNLPTSITPSTAPLMMSRSTIGTPSTTIDLPSRVMTSEAVPRIPLTTRRKYGQLARSAPPRSSRAAAVGSPATTRPSGSTTAIARKSGSDIFSSAISVRRTSMPSGCSMSVYAASDRSVCRFSPIQAFTACRDEKLVISSFDATSSSTRPISARAETTRITIAGSRTKATMRRKIACEKANGRRSGRCVRAPGRRAARA